jgi:hypothetical protein
MALRQPCEATGAALRERPLAEVESRQALLHLGSSQGWRSVTGAFGRDRRAGAHGGRVPGRPSGRRTPCRTAWKAAGRRYSRPARGVSGVLAACRQGGEAERPVGLPQRARTGAAARSPPRPRGSAARAPAAPPSKAQHRLGREAPELLQLLLGQRGAERRDGAGEARLVQRDDVHVALDRDDLAPRKAPSRARSSRRGCVRLRKSGVSGPLTYFGWPSPRMRPPKLMVRPRRSRIGNITRLKKKSRGGSPASRSRSSPASIELVLGLMPSAFRSPQRAAPGAGPAEAEARMVSSVRPRREEVGEPSAPSGRRRRR